MLLFETSREVTVMEFDTLHLQNLEDKIAHMFSP